MWTTPLITAGTAKLWTASGGASRAGNWTLALEDWLSANYTALRTPRRRSARLRGATACGRWRRMIYGPGTGLRRDYPSLRNNGLLNLLCWWRGSNWRGRSFSNRRDSGGCRWRLTGRCDDDGRRRGRLFWCRRCRSGRLGYRWRYDRRFLWRHDCWSRWRFGRDDSGLLRCRWSDWSCRFCGNSGHNWWWRCRCGYRPWRRNRTMELLFSFS